MAYGLLASTYITVEKYMRIPRVLVVYYSRTRKTEHVAYAICTWLELRGLRCDVESLREPVSRSGLLGYLRSGLDAARARTGPLLPLIHDPKKYDVVVVGSPLWSGSVSTPVRSFLNAHAGRLRKVAFFLTHSGSAADDALAQMRALAARVPVAQIAVVSSGLASGTCQRALQPFADEIARAASDSVAAELLNASASTLLH